MLIASILGTAQFRNCLYILLKSISEFKHSVFLFIIILKEVTYLCHGTVTFHKTKTLP